MQGDQPTEKRQSPSIKEGAKNFIKFPFAKGGGFMITYSESIQTAMLIIAIAGFILNAIKVYHDIKKK